MTSEDLDMLKGAVWVANHEGQLSDEELDHLVRVIERLRGISRADIDDVSNCLHTGQKSLTYNTRPSRPRAAPTTPPSR